VKNIQGPGRIGTGGLPALGAQGRPWLISRVRPAVVVASQNAAAVASTDLRDNPGEDGAFMGQLFPAGCADAPKRRYYLRNGQNLSPGLFFGGAGTFRKQRKILSASRMRRDREGGSNRHCEEHLRRSNPLFLYCGSMDCFASLAMTVEVLDCFPRQSGYGARAIAGTPRRRH
jgi:hypothetical protein